MRPTTSVRPCVDALADVVEVRGAAADDDAERDDRVVAAVGEDLGDDRQLEAAGHPQQASAVDAQVGSARSAPSTRPSMTCSCHCAAITATRRSPQFSTVSSGAPLPLTVLLVLEYVLVLSWLCWCL